MMAELHGGEGMMHIARTFAALEPGEGIVLVRADADEEDGEMTIFMQELPAGMGRSVLRAARSILKGAMNN
jgi:hypothetical protein